MNIKESFHKVDKSIELTSSTSLSYTGLNFTIPADSIYCIQATAIYANSQPNETLITDTYPLPNSWSNEGTVAYRTTDNGPISITTGFTGSSSKTLYVYGRWGSVGRNIASMTGFYIQLLS